MIAIVTTWQGVFAFDTGTGEYWLLHSQRGPYCGVAYDDESIYVGARGGKGLGCPVIQLPYTLRPAELVQPRDSYVGQVHQATMIDERLWLMGTANDCVVTWNRKNDAWKEWYPAGKTLDGDDDVYHFNSMWCDGNKLALLSHNYGKSRIWVYSYPELRLERLLRIGKRAHNVWQENGRWHVLSSQEGKVLRLIDNRIKTLVVTGGFPRGVVVLPERRFVGISQHRQRSERAKSRSAIIVYDKNWKRVRTWMLPTWGVFYEIRIPGHADLAYGSPQTYIRKAPRPAWEPDGVLDILKD